MDYLRRTKHWALSALILSALLGQSCYAPVETTKNDLPSEDREIWVHIWNVADTGRVSDATKWLWLHNADDQTIASIARYSSEIRGIAAPYSKITSNGCQSFVNLKHLEYLDVSGSASLQSSDIAAVLSNLPKLTVLDVSFTQANDAAVFAIRHPARLTLLKFAGCNISDEAMVHLCSNCRNLIEFSVAACMALTDKGFRAIGTLSRLEVLIVSGCIWITDSICSKFTPLVRLRSVTLGRTFTLSHIAVERLGRLEQLEEVDCALSATAAQASPEAWSKLRRLRRVSILLPTGTPVVAFEWFFVTLGHLDYLSMEGGTMASVGTDIFTNAERLTTLRLSNMSDVTLDCLKEILNCRSLEVLVIRTCPNVDRQVIGAVRELRPSLLIDFGSEGQEGD